MVEDPEACDALDDVPNALAGRAGAGFGVGVEVAARVEAGVNDGLIPSAGSGGI